MSTIHDRIPGPSPDATRPEPPPPSRPARDHVGGRAMTTLMIRLWPAVAALALGCVAAVVILSVALQSEFPLFAEASAARGRDCTTIRSARQALDRELERHLAALGPHPVESRRGVQDAVAAFHAATSDIETSSVAAALGEVDRRLDALSATVGAAGQAGTGRGSDRTGTVVDATVADRAVDTAWQGAIARVCS